MGEFELIRRFFYPIADAAKNSALGLGLGDDCAIQRVPEGEELVFSIDTLVEGVHFPEGYNPARLGWRGLAVAASDLAAMGATPVCFTLALTLPKADPEWLRAFSDSLAGAAARFGLVLAGGDTTRGPLAMTFQVHGTVPDGRALLRSGARVGDLVCVSGTLGDAGAALDLLSCESPSDDQAYLLERYHAPWPRLGLGQSLRNAASAAIDISDGLVADLRHLLSASGVGATVRVDSLPLSEALARTRGDAEELALFAGDDYELCVAIAESTLAALPRQVREQLTVIGQVHPGSGIRLEGGSKALNEALNDGRLSGKVQGYDHFGGDE